MTYVMWAQRRGEHFFSPITEQGELALGEEQDQSPKGGKVIADYWVDPERGLSFAVRPPPTPGDAKPFNLLVMRIGKGRSHLRCSECGRVKPAEQMNTIVTKRRRERYACSACLTKSPH